jgi:hypothetical protein
VAYRIIQGVSFKRQPQNNNDNQVKVTLVARPLLMPAKVVQVRTWCIHEEKVYSFSDITLHQNNLLLFVKL